MGKTLNITDDQRAQARRNIENGFMFTEDVLADPTLLDGIPDDAEVIAIPIEECEPGRRYDVVTPRTVAMIAAPSSGTSSPMSAARRR